MAPSDTKTLYAAVHTRVDELLQYVWDPIGVAHVPEARDEYTSYVPTVARLLLEERKKEEIVAYLHKIASEHMGLSENPAALAHEEATVTLLIRHYQDLKKRA